MRLGNSTRSSKWLPMAEDPVDPVDPGVAPPPCSWLILWLTWPHRKWWRNESSTGFHPIIIGKRPMISFSVSHRKWSNDIQWSFKNWILKLQYSKLTRKRCSFESPQGSSRELYLPQRCLHFASEHPGKMAWFHLSGHALHLGMWSNPLSLLLNLPCIIKTTPDYWFWETSDWPIWLNWHPSENNLKIKDIKVHLKVLYPLNNKS